MIEPCRGRYVTVEHFAELLQQRPRTVAPRPTRTSLNGRGGRSDVTTPPGPATTTRHTLDDTPNLIRLRDDRHLGEHRLHGVPPAPGAHGTWMVAVQHARPGRFRLQARGAGTAVEGDGGELLQVDGDRVACRFVTRQC